MNKSSGVVLLIVLSLLWLPIAAEDKYEAGDQSLLLLPTAYTMPKGTYSLASYELIFLQFTMAITSSTHITAASIFPVTYDAIKSFTPGIKQRYWKSDNVQAALVSGININQGIFHLGSVVSLGQPEKSLHIAGSFISKFGESDHFYLFAVGGRKDVRKRLALLAEIAVLIESNFEDALTVLNIGVRFKGQQIVWELGGMRPLEDMSDADLLLFPLLKASVYF